MSMGPRLRASDPPCPPASSSTMAASTFGLIMLRLATNLLPVAQSLPIACGRKEGGARMHIEAGGVAHVTQGERLAEGQEMAKIL